MRSGGGGGGTPADTHTELAKHVAKVDLEQTESDSETGGGAEWRADVPDPRCRWSGARGPASVAVATLLDLQRRRSRD